MSSLVTEPIAASPSAPRSGETLASVFDLRSNAIAFLRHAFCLTVILGHAWEVGGFGFDPLKEHCGVTLGRIGVQGFFVIGGFLVTASFLNLRSARIFALNRALRILPGYWVCLILTALVLVPGGLHLLGAPASASAASPSEYLGFVQANALLKIRQQTIGAVFATHPAAGVVNGSLWSIFPEAFCYLCIAAVGVLGVLRGRGRVLLLAAFAATLTFWALAPGILAGTPWQSKTWFLAELAGLAASFCGGSALWVFRERIPFSRGVRVGSLFVLLIVIATGAYRYVGPLALTFAVLALASLLPWTRGDRLGDFSYGLYLYHYPIQQLLYASPVRPDSPLLFFAGSVLLALPFAALSWFWIERPALHLKPRAQHRATA